MTPVTGTTQRKAAIEVEQLPNGYWRGHVSVRVPGLRSPHEQESYLFHDAGEAWDWARQTIEFFEFFTQAGPAAMSAWGTPAGQSVAIACDLHDDDGAVIALQTRGTTRGQARAYFAREREIDFRAVRIRREWFYDSPEYRAEMAADDIPEPYDGWPLTQCEWNTPGAVEFWVLAEECR